MFKPEVTPKVQERRAKLLQFLSMGYSQREVSKELQVSEGTISHDIQELENESRNFIEDLAKKTFGFMYVKSLVGIESIIKNCWEQWHKTKNGKFMTILLDAYCKRIELLGDGPAVYAIQRIGIKNEA